MDGALPTVSSPMTDLLITAGPFTFQARFEPVLAPRTCEIFRKLLPYQQRVIHVRWSGEAVWIPLGDTHMGVPAENQTSYPAPGQMILYPGGISETEILLAYGGVRFASKVGNSPATTSSPSPRRSTIWRSSESWCCGKARSRFRSERRSRPKRADGRPGRA